MWFSAKGCHLTTHSTKTMTRFARAQAHSLFLYLLEETPGVVARYQGDALVV